MEKILTSYFRDNRTGKLYELADEQARADIEQLKENSGGEGTQGPQGPQGPPGNDYILTASDKEEIATLVLALLPSETWTFTLEDGTTATKKVVVISD